MLKMSDFLMIQAQAAIFTPGLKLNATRVLGRLSEKYPDVFDGDPILLPSPPADFPLAAETPRLLLQSRDGKRRWQAAASRLDVVQAGDNLEASHPLPAFLDRSLQMFDDYLEVTQSRAARVACVVTRLALHSQPAKEIALHFCKPALLAEHGPLNRPSDFEIHAAKQFDLLEGLRINSWFRCKSAVLKLADGQQRIGVLTEQDFNTLLPEDESREFGAQERRRFFERIPQEFQKVMDLYFQPTEAQGATILS